MVRANLRASAQVSDYCLGLTLLLRANVIAKASAQGKEYCLGLTLLLRANVIAEASAQG